MADVVNKPWGTTKTLIDHPNNSTHRIMVVAGGYCSMHYHERKWNAFVVVRGALTIISSDQGAKEINRTVLRVGDVYTVAPGVRHRFINETDAWTEALEYYYPDGLGEDIVRFDTGGKTK